MKPEQMDAVAVEIVLRLKDPSGRQEIGFAVAD